MKKLYVIVRADLPAGAQLAQSVHAAIAFAIEHRERTRGWHADSNNLVVLAVPDEVALSALSASAAELDHVEFREPDFGGELTAIALGAGAERLVSSLPLALRAPRAA